MLVDFTVNRDSALLNRLRQGDREALSELYRIHHPAVYRFALYLTADPGAAADVTQDVFVWLMDHADRFDPNRGQLSAFLGGVARKFVSRSRVETQRFEVLHREIERAVPLLAPGAAADTSRVPQLLRAIAALPLRYREAVALCDLEGKSYEEASVILECPVGTVRSRLHRARGLLARKLEPEGLREGCYAQRVMP
jgi:RNA polymerase sigma-70 factor (ECF subfamily)